MDDSEFLTPDEVARRLRVSGHTIRRMLNKHKLPGVKVGDQWRIRRSDLEAYLAAQSTQSGQD